MSKIDQCCLSVDRVGKGGITKIEQNADLTMLVTGIHALGKGEIKLADYITSMNANVDHLYFTSKAGFPLLMVKVMRAEQKSGRIVAYRCGTGSSYDGARELVGSNNPRHVLKVLSEVRAGPGVRIRRRKRDISALGNSVAEFLSHSRDQVTLDVAMAFQWTVTSTVFDRLNILPDCSRQLYPSVIWAMLRVFNETISAADITDPTARFTAERLYKEMLDKSEKMKKVREEFLEFWSKPKHVIGLLPTFMLSETTASMGSAVSGLALAEYDFSKVANEFVQSLNEWNPISFDKFKLETMEFKYYDKLNNLDADVLADIKAKCGFIKMFGKGVCEYSSHATQLNTALESDLDMVLPIMNQDTAWKDVNALAYAAGADINRYTHWLILDKG